MRHSVSMTMCTLPRSKDVLKGLGTLNGAAARVTIAKWETFRSQKSVREVLLCRQKSMGLQCPNHIVGTGLLAASLNPSGNRHQGDGRYFG